MYNLRSRTKFTELVDSENNTSEPKKRTRDDVSQLEGSTESDPISDTSNLSTNSDINKSKGRTPKRRKTSEQEYIEPNGFNPSLFKKGNHYKGIRDSSDSDTQEDYVHMSEEDNITSEFSGNSTLSDESSNSENADESSDSENANESLSELGEDGCEDGEYDPDLNTYFDIDRSPLIAVIAKKLKDKFPDLDDKDLRTAISKSIDNARADLVEEYCGAIPKDASWKAELTPEDADRLEPQLKEIRRNLRENTPTIAKILKCGLSVAEKERVLQLYDILKNMEPYTFKHMELSMQIMDIIRTAPPTEDKTYDDKIKGLRLKIDDKMPTVEKIIAARLMETDKMRALQLYETFQQCPFNSEEWFNLQRRINCILDGAFESDESLAKFEAEEEALKKSMISFTEDLKRRIFELDADADVKSRLYEMYCDMMSRSSTDHDYATIKDKIMWAIKLPYRKQTIPLLADKTNESISNYCNNTYAQLDAEIYGMKEAKMRIIQALNDRIYNPTSRSLLALKGKPGVGKTKLAKIIAKVAGRPFDKISLGGAIDSTIFKGSDNVWSGAAPSMLLQILSRVKYSNAVILLDEFDKLASTDRGIEVQNSLLHVLDPSQNKEFQDAFLNEFPHDISNIWFIPAMNDDANISSALRDRLDIIEIPSYTRDDMVQIIKLHTLPEAILDKGIPEGTITITDDAARHLLFKLGDQIDNSGMRTVEKAINNIVSKLNLLRTMYNGDSIVSTIPLPYNLKDFHGLPYTITPETISVLHVAPKPVYLSYMS